MSDKAKTRRGHGSGAVFQIQSGRDAGKWVAALDLGYVADPNDPEKKKRKRVTRTRATEREAIAALDDIKRQHHMGTLQTGKSPRLSDYLQQWFDEQGAARWRPNSIAAHRQSVGHVTRALGHLRIDQLQPRHVRGMLNDMAATYSRSTITGAKTILTAALTDAVNDGLIARNVASGVRMPKHVATPATEARFMTEDELQRFIASAGRHDDGAALIVAVTTGLRIGELLGLRWHPESVDMDTGLLHVTKQVQPVSPGGGWRLVELKTDTSARTIPLPAVAIAALKRQKRRQLEDRVLAGGRWQDHGFVFTGPHGQPMGRDRARRSLAEVLDMAGIASLRFHDLRHSFASYLIAHGHDLLTVRDLCGHRSIQITADTYGHLFPSRKAEAMTAWDALETAS